jgi:hydrogenase maturation protein HypF
MDDAPETLLRSRSSDAMTSGDHLYGRRLEIRGRVQGVGFRPFVHRLATELGLVGSVRNAGGHVVVDVVGSTDVLEEFARRLIDEAPPLADVTEVDECPLSVGIESAGIETAGIETEAGFLVEMSDSTATEVMSDLPPDVATCDDCLRELADPFDRRYRYPFINCTNCGPRATIINDLPYDRERTVMRSFPLCADCAKEYADPTNRRFHAEPIACSACGPTLVWRGPGSTSGRTRGSDALLAAVTAIDDGNIVAVKGLGGYQLVCDATQPEVLARLRERKHRLTKPVAIMVADLAALREIAYPTADEEALLTSRERPIVLVRSANRLPAAVHPDTGRVGVFLPNTPLHHLLLAELRRPLVVTSGNRTDEPMVCDNDRAIESLGRIADGFLQHDRDIAARYDDSVLQVVGDRPRMMRRARGYAPAALRLPLASRTPILAVGAELKHTFTLATAGRALIGPHTGDLEDVESFDSFERSLAHLSRIEGTEPELVAHDMHPGYLSTQYAMRYPASRRMPVQHHHAHVAACAAEFGVVDPFIGVAYDGLGFGTDGTLWGGEILIADLAEFRRFARFSRAPLPGGKAAIRHPSRMAMGYLFGAEGFGTEPGVAGRTSEFLNRLDPRAVAIVQRLVAAGTNCPQASSAGRLFDAVASLVHLRDDVSYEGEAAMQLENTAAPHADEELAWMLRRSEGLVVYDVRSTLRHLLSEVANGVSAAELAARFHLTMVAVTVALCHEARLQTGLRTVCLGGGVFQNRRLTGALTTALTAEGFFVFAGEQVPANDGGISFGQAAIASARRKD